MNGGEALRAGARRAGAALRRRRRSQGAPVGGPADALDMVLRGRRIQRRTAGAVVVGQALLAAAATGLVLLGLTWWLMT